MTHSEKISQREKRPSNKKKTIESNLYEIWKNDMIRVWIKNYFISSTRNKKKNQNLIYTKIFKLKWTADIDLTNIKRKKNRYDNFIFIFFGMHLILKNPIYCANSERKKKLIFEMNYDSVNIIFWKLSNQISSDLL